MLAHAQITQVQTLHATTLQRGQFRSRVEIANGTTLSSSLICTESSVNALPTSSETNTANWRWRGAEIFKLLQGRG